MTNRTVLTILMAICIAFLGLAGSASAYNITGNSLYLNTQRGDIFSVNKSTGQATYAFSSGIRNLTDIAFAGKNVYGITHNKLYSIDSTTGSSSRIRLNWSGVSGFNRLSSANSLVSHGGLLYTANNYNYGGYNYHQLLSIDPTTGNVRTVGDFAGYKTSGDMAFDSKGVLYTTVNGRGTSWLAQVDLVTGATTLLGNTGFQNVYGLAYMDGTLTGLTSSGRMIGIDALTGKGSLLGYTGQSAWGADATAVPIPGAVWLLGSGLLGLMGFRKKIRS